jgi:dipeptidyl aminopeptidase/acylaminoacyl peptidase
MNVVSTVRRRLHLAWVLMCLAAAALPWPVLAQTSAPNNPPAAALLPAELFFKPADVLEARLSPSGRRLAITTIVGGARVGLYVWDLAPNGKPTQAARFVDADIASYAWVNDERLVFTLIDLSEGGGRQDAPGLFSVRFDGEQMRQLVMRRGLPFISGPITGRPPLPWHHRLLYVPRGASAGADGADNEEVIVGDMQIAGNELRALRPLRLNVVSGRVRDLELQAPDRTVNWIFDSLGQPRVAVTVAEGRRQLHWRAPGQERWKQIDDSDWLQTPFEPHSVDAQGRLYVTRSRGVEGYRVLARFDFETGKPEDKAFVQVPGFDFAGRLISDARTGQLLGVRVNTDGEITTWFDEGMKRLQLMADERLPGYVNQLSCARCGASDMTLLVRSWSDRDPGHLWLYRAEDKSWQLISRVRKGADPQRMATVDLERIRARDGRELPLWLTVPPGRKPGAGGPAVVLVHGGPWVRDGYWRWKAMEQFLASRGYVVISPEFRGSTGYGAAHFRAGFKQWGQAMQDDVADAARWAMAQGWADRLCIAGASYGGYSTLMGLVRDGDLYKCGVAWVAVADPLLYLKGSWWVNDDISDSARGYSMPTMVGDADKDAEMLKAASPVQQAARIRAPLLLAYGERDRRVPIEHGERLRKAMRAAGLEPQWVSYPDEGHGWLKQETRLDFARRIEAFLGQHLK